ncbi:hypothetical protein [Blastopirellula marina]|uniref:Uncharacterized protein n=1 Tax=Blastopirellula marina TaxID=124 RepID=A0A2S8GQT4_9BACT|nr:hypothetical protein [Blastopirellula marina]PQO46762.1 hypothetical protein C5Y93_07985 [Blastopirellula marina]
MQWLTFDQARRRCEQLPHATDLQYLSVEADFSQLYRDIPVEPDYVPPSDGSPSPVHRWYFAIEDRVASIEVEVDESYRELTVTLETPYFDRQRQSGDWTVLREFVGLPASIRLRRPHQIFYRCEKPRHVLYLPSGKGWYSPVYGAVSRREINELWDFVQQDPEKNPYVIGPPEPEGDWGLFVREVQGVVARGELHRVLRSGYGWSMRFPTLEYKAYDVSGVSPHVYHIRNGKVDGPQLLDW